MSLRRHLPFGAVTSSWLRRALALAALAWAQAGLAALSPADLQVALSGPASAASNTVVTYTATLTNVALWKVVCVFDPETRRKVCDDSIASADAFNATMDVTLPAGFVATGASGAGFSCSLGQTVRCTRGLLGADVSAAITITARTPTVTASTAFTTTAVADPTRAIPERSESNNTATETVTVTAPPPPPPPPPPQADLWVYEDVSPTTFVAALGATYTVSVHNAGPVAANGFQVQMHTNLPAALNSWSLGPFACTAGGGYTQALSFQCTGSVPAYSSATMTFQVKPTNNFTPSGTPLTLYGYVDSTYAIPESNESNNSFTKAAIVQ